MPLKLDEYKSPEDYIEYGGEKFIITAEIPPGIFKVYKKFKDTKEPGEQIKLLDEFVLNILSFHNDIEKVKTFINKITFSDKIKISNFYNAFVAETLQSPETKKKKKKSKRKFSSKNG